jgi:hypothetical protein
MVHFPVIWKMSAKYLDLNNSISDNSGDVKVLAYRGCCDVFETYPLISDLLFWSAHTAGFLHCMDSPHGEAGGARCRVTRQKGHVGRVGLS